MFARIPVYRRAFSTTCLRLDATATASSSTTVAIRDQLKTALKTAMKAKKVEQTQVVKSLMADIKYFEQSFSPPKDADDASVLSCIQKAHQQRMDSVKQFTAADRPDLAEKEASEAEFIQQFLPTPLTTDEINAILVRLIDTHSVPPGDNKAIGRLLKAFWEEVEKVRANGPEVAKMAREILSKK